MLAASIVAAAVGIAVAAVPEPPKLRADPPVRIVHSTGPGMTTSTFSIINQTADPVSIASITMEPSCDPDVSLVLATPATVPGNGTISATLQCAGAFTTGLARCTFHANLAVGSAVLDFEGVCEGGQQATMSASPSDIDFGDVPVGGGASTTTMLSSSAATAVSRLSLHTTDLDGTFELAAPCNPDARACDAPIAPIANGQSTPITIWCRPKTAGTHTAELHVASSTGHYLSAPITLTCNGTAASTPVLAITGDPLNAGDVEVIAGTASPMPLRLRNAGSGMLQITKVQIVDSGNGAAADWSYVASGECSGSVTTVCELAPEEVLSLRLQLDPSVIGPRHATLVISYFDTAVRSRSIPLAGRGLGATLSLVGAPVELDFGTVPLNVTSDLPFQLSNQGNRAIAAMLSMTPSVPAFSLSPSASINVGPATPATVVASCRPTAPGEVTTTIHAEGSDAFMAGSALLDIPVKCEGTSSTLFTVPSSLRLGEVHAGPDPVAVPIQVQVSTGAQLQIVSAAFAVQTTKLSVSTTFPVMTPTTIQIMVDPTTEGVLDNELVIVASNGSTVRVPVSGAVATAAYEEPLARSLGTFCVNQPTTSNALQFKSTGNATLLLDMPAMELGPMSPFDIEPQAPASYPALLAPSSNARIEITPRRQGSAGVQQDDVVWTTDVPGAETVHTTISARFVDDGGAIAPDALSFGAGTIHLEQDNAQSVTLQNCDTVTIVFDEPTVPAPFRIDSNNFPDELAPNERATFTIGFHPTRVGIFDEVLTITSEQLDPEHPLEVRLTGEGAKPQPPPDSGIDPPGKDPESFYGCGGCATRSPSGGLVIVIVLGATLRRRRA